MNKTKSINFRMTEEMHHYLKQKARNENLQLSPLLEKIVQHDMNLNDGYAEDLAEVISKKLKDDLTFIKNTVCGNNQMLKEIKNKLVVEEPKPSSSGEVRRRKMR
jgi:hypothetical protein